LRGYIQGGRFDADFESDSISAGINQDLQRPVGTHAEWWIYDPENTTIDSIYDVGATDGTGRRWIGPYNLPIIRSVIKQGAVPTSAQGYYNADTLHLTINAEDLIKISPNVVNHPDLQNRGRIVWLNEVFRPSYVQQRAIVADRFSLITVECIQVTREELVNDPQFSKYATNSTSMIKTTLPPGYGFGAGPYGDDAPTTNGYGA
jgi:hypothetical protein